MRIRLTRAQWGGRCDLASFEAVGEAAGFPVTGAAYRLVRDNGVPMTTTEVDEVEVRHDAEGVLFKFRTIAGAWWVGYVLPDVTAVEGACAAIEQRAGLA